MTDKRKDEMMDDCLSDAITDVTKSYAKATTGDTRTYAGLLFTQERFAEAVLEAAAIVEFSRNEVKRLNEHLDSYTDMLLKERKCTEEYIKELRAASAPPVPDDVSEAIKYLRSYEQALKNCSLESVTEHIETLIRAASTPSAEVRALRAALRKYVDLPVMTFPASDGINRIYYSGEAARKALNHTGGK